MSGRPPSRELPEPTIRLTDGWHCLHAYFAAQPGDRRVDRDRLLAALDPGSQHAPQRLQTFAVTGHRADLGVMAMDPDPLRLDAVLQEVRVAAGEALRPTYSFVSITEISEYVPSASSSSRSDCGGRGRGRTIPASAPASPATRSGCRR